LKVLIAIDSFKGCASSNELAQHIKKGILKVYSDTKIEVCPIADGGEGTVEALSAIDGARLVTSSCKDPLGNDIKATYTILENNVGVIEMASASGLPLVPNDKRDPRITSTYGTGDLIRDAIKKGVREFVIGLGGSATNDAGLGMLRALGFRFYDDCDNQITLAKDLGKIVRFDKFKSINKLNECKFMIACDVNNPLYGENGATHVYAKQKGADEAMILELDEQLRLFSKVVLKDGQKDLASFPGSGAAGGLGFGFLAFLNAELKSGIDIVLDKVKFKEQVKDANFVITGEGKIDRQSSMGKVISGIGKICQENKIPCIALAGDSSEADDSLHEVGISACFSILNAPMDLEKAMKKDVALELVEKKAEQIFRLIKISA
jgi:glycerate kinase